MAAFPDYPCGLGERLHDAILTVCLAIGSGALLVIAGQRLKTPAIVLLLAGGILLGPEFLNLVQPAVLGRGMETLVAVLVAVILFEGGITLDMDGYRRAPIAIRRLLLVGPLVTCLGAAAAAYGLFGVTPRFALVAGSLVIVTGPTVVSPLLRRLHINERLHHILYWEAVLIDAVGVFVAVLCFEWLIPTDQSSIFGALARFALRVLSGGAMGAGSGLLMAHVLKRRYIANEYVNIFVLACALLTFASAHALQTESGILAVVVAGLIVAIKKPRQLARVQQFKLQLTELAIGTLFVLLAAKLELQRFWDARLLIFLGVVMMVLRPLSVALATAGQGFALREKALLSWIAPRGIVAASMASLFSLRLADMGYQTPELLETLTYAVIGATVSVQGLSAPLVAKLLGLANPKRKSWVLAGHPRLVNPLAQALQRAGARAISITALGGAIDEIHADDARFADARGLLALHIDSQDNFRVVQRLRDSLPTERAYLWNGERTSTTESGVFSMPTAVTEIWNGLGAPEELLLDLEAHNSCIDVIELGDEESAERFGTGIRPLFFVHDGVANLVDSPTDHAGQRGDLVVAVRKRIQGLRDLIADVVVVDHAQPTFESVVEVLVERVRAQGGAVDRDGMIEGILTREDSMSTALGNGVAIPHAYVDSASESRCFVAGVPAGLKMATPDGEPIRLIFMLVSPLGQARTHLQALAAIAELAQDATLIGQLSRQKIPDRLRRFIAERA